MSIEHIQRDDYTCDFCGVVSVDGLYRTWFVVNRKYHACISCGHLLHYALSDANVDHTFVCHEYARELIAPGEIEVSDSKSLMVAMKMSIEVLRRQRDGTLY